MKHLEIDSDKLTTVGVCGLLLFAFGEAVVQARNLLVHHYNPLSRNWSNYLASAAFVCMFLTSLPDRKLWREYPYGAPGFALYAADFVMKCSCPERLQEQF